VSPWISTVAGSDPVSHATEGLYILLFVPPAHEIESSPEHSKDLTISILSLYTLRTSPRPRPYRKWTWPKETNISQPTISHCKADHRQRKWRPRIARVRYLEIQPLSVTSKKSIHRRNSSPPAIERRISNRRLPHKLRRMQTVHWRKYQSIWRSIKVRHARSL